MKGTCGLCGREGVAMRLSEKYGVRCNSGDACTRRMLAVRNAANPREGDRRFKANRVTP